MSNGVQHEAAEKYISELEKEIQQVKAEVDGKFRLNQGQWDKFVNVAAYFLHLKDEFWGKLIKMDCRPENIHCEIMVDISHMDAVGADVAWMGSALCLADCFDMAATDHDTILIGAGVNDVWEAVS